MKKVLAAVLALALVFTLAACGSKGVQVKLTYNEGSSDAKTIGAEFYYPEDAGYEVEAEPDYVELIDAEEDYVLEVALYEDARYTTKMEWAKETMSEAYKDVELLGYKGHSYYYVGGYVLFLLLEEVGENARYICFDLSGGYYDEGAEQFFNESKEIQHIVNSLVYLGEITEEAK